MFIPFSYIEALASCLQEKALPPFSGPLPKPLPRPTHGHDMAPLSAFLDMVAQAEACIDHPGLHFSRYLPLTAHGHLSTAIFSSKNVLQALDVICRYTRSRVQIMDASMTFSRNAATLSYDLSDSLLPHWQFFEESIAASLFNGATFLVGPQAAPSHIAFSQSAPGSTTAFDFLGETQLDFGAEKLHITFRHDALSLPSPFHNQELFDIATGFCEQQLDNFLSEKTMRQRVYDHLSSDMKNPGLEETALSMKLTPRSLRARLNEEGTSFQKISREVKLNHALFLLSRPGATVQSVSEKMGYQDVASFSASFKRWSGYSPTQMRKQ